VLILGHGGRISCKAIDLAKSAACIPMEVQVRTLAGKVTSVPIAPWHLVSDLKNTVHSLDGKEIRIKYGGSENTLHYLRKMVIKGDLGACAFLLIHTVVFASQCV